jgi:hypothetical protein
VVAFRSRGGLVVSLGFTATAAVGWILRVPFGLAGGRRLVGEGDFEVSVGLMGVGSRADWGGPGGRWARVKGHGLVKAHAD